jgi:restriction endonuclease S subunit
MNVLSYPTYVRFPKEITDRLSYGDNHPAKEAFYATMDKAKRKGFDLKQLDSVVQLIEDNVDPAKECAEQTVLYLGLEGIEPNTGNAIYKSCLGKNIRSTAKRFHRGNIVFADLRPYLNKAHLVKVEEALGSSELFVILPDKEQVVPEFLLTYLLSDLVLNQTKWILTGSSYPRLHGEDFKHLLVILPKKPEQTAILQQLQPLEQEATTKEAEAKRLNEEGRNVILAELGFSVDSEETANYFFKTSSEAHTLWFTVSPPEITDRMHYLFFHPRYHALDALDGRFSIVPLAKICREPIVRGEQPDYDESGTVRVLKTVDLRDGYIDYDNALKVSEDFFIAHPIAHVHKNDILIASTGYVSMGKVDIYDREEPAMVDGHISIVRVNKNYDPYFIAYFLRCHFGRLQFEKWFTGSSGQIELQPTDLGRFIVPDNSETGVPLNEQKRISILITEYFKKSKDFQYQAKAQRQEVRKTFVEIILGSNLDY